MKPEHWARAAVSEPGWWQAEPALLIDFDALRGHVTAAIRAAVAEGRAEEREACAEIAIQHGWLCEQRSHDPEWIDKAEQLFGGGVAAAKIEGSIRARGGS